MSNVLMPYTASQLNLNIEYNVPLNEYQFRVELCISKQSSFNLETTNILSLLIFHVTILQHIEEPEISEEKYEIEILSSTIKLVGVAGTSCNVAMINPDPKAEFDLALTVS